MAENEIKFLPTINYSETIIKERMVYERNTWNNIIYRAFQLLFTLYLLGSLVAAYNLVLEMQFIVALLAFISAVWIVSGFFYINKLLKVEGHEILINKEDAITTLKYFYSDLTFDESQDNILRDFKIGTLSSPGRIISVIFSDNKIFFHKITLGRGNAMMPLYGPIDYLKIKKIANHFTGLQHKVIKTSPTEI